jgi:uncharacterized protein YndB with AHSA1/START domain
MNMPPCATFMGTHQVAVHIAAPPERVFRLWIDLDRMMEWVGGVTKVTDVTGPVDQAGTRYTVWFGPMASRTEVLEADPPRLLRTRFRSRTLAGESAAKFEPEGDGTRIIQEFRTEGRIAAIFGWLFSRGSYNGSFQGELNKFGRLAEAEVSTDPQ